MEASGSRKLKVVQTMIYKIRTQAQTVRKQGIEPIFHINLKWSIILKNTESLCCTPETNVINVNQLYINEKKKRKES